MVMMMQQQNSSAQPQSQTPRRPPPLPPQPTIPALDPHTTTHAPRQAIPIAAAADQAIGPVVVPISVEPAVNSELLRENLERIVGVDDSTFSGLDLATLIRKKYGRSYDVQLIKKEFMGRNLLALNVMWKYMEQRSFPLTEEEYILRLDDVANTLKCWGAVSHIRNSLAKLKERPRIGKAVSIFIDMDESGGRANEWIYK
ncbi:DUF3067 family protein [Citrus sinensis]|uniref:DUF3067 family protein n=1 Tax=Citrus sinensis TaxID=2711 RepID=A0ACB8LDT8_CITSI|nr:DUF3067 family protein [Citrus sinensis]